MPIGSQRTRLAIILTAIWAIVTVVCGSFYVYYPWKSLKNPSEEYVAYPDFRTAQFLVLWLIPTFLYAVVSLVAIVKVRNKSG